MLVDWFALFVGEFEIELQIGWLLLFVAHLLNNISLMDVPYIWVYCMYPLGSPCTEIGSFRIYLASLAQGADQ